MPNIASRGREDDRGRNSAGADELDVVDPVDVGKPAVEPRTKAKGQQVDDRLKVLVKAVDFQKSPEVGEFPAHRGQDHGRFEPAHRAGLAGRLHSASSPVSITTSSSRPARWMASCGISPGPAISAAPDDRDRRTGRPDPETGFLGCRADLGQPLGRAVDLGGLLAGMFGDRFLQGWHGDHPPPATTATSIGQPLGFFDVVSGHQDRGAA